MSFNKGNGPSVNRLNYNRFKGHLGIDVYVKLNSPTLNNLIQLKLNIKKSIHFNLTYVIKILLNAISNFNEILIGINTIFKSYCLKLFVNKNLL